MPKEVVRSGEASIAVGWTSAQYAQLSLSGGPGLTVLADDRESFDCLVFDFTERRQINELIRNLRKARDSAFGRDE